MEASKEDIKYSLEELKEKLTGKEKVFCHEYIIEWNGAKSAIKAGYSEDRARQTAYDIVTKGYIQQYIDFIKNDYEKEAGITKLSQIKGFQEIINDVNASFRDKISARVELNKMLGYNEAEKHDHKVSTKVISLGRGKSPNE